MTESIKPYLDMNVSIGHHSIVHPTCTFGKNVTIKDFVELQEGTRIGNNTIIDHYVLSRGDNTIGCNVTVKPRVTLCRGLTVEDNVFLSPNVMTAYATVKRGKRVGTRIGEGTFIGTNTLIGAGVKIGKRCVIGAHTFLNHAEIGNDCYIGSLANIGGQGIWVDRQPNGRLKRRHAKEDVIIMDDVSVGDGTMIQRGFERDTIIKSGTHIGPYALIGHDSTIGYGCIVVGRAWLCGFTVMEDRSRMSPGIVKQRTKIGHDAMVGIGSLVLHDVPPCTTVAGHPAVDISVLRRRKDEMQSVST